MSLFPAVKKMLLLIPAAFLLIAAVFWSGRLPALPDNGDMHTFKAGMMGLLLEALPFVLAGSVVSAAIGVLVPDETIARVIPRRVIPALLAASLLGVVFPICECGMIPLVRRLLPKGLPLHAGIAFILAGPILNPLVFGATLSAFRSEPSLAYARIGLAFAVSVTAGLMVYATVRKSPLRLTLHTGGREAHNEGLRGGKLAAVFTHAADDFFDMGKYLVFGCALTALIQTFADHGSLAAMGGRPLGSYVFMMGFAFVLSLCSTSDAFVAASFHQTFPPGALLAFMVLGPMLDIKNALMLLSLFKTRFALYLFFLILSMVFTGSIAVSLWL